MGVLGRQLGRRCGRWLLALGFALLMLMVLAWVIVHALVLPRVPAWKPWIEQRITSALGQSVSIGALAVESRGGALVATLSDVRLLDTQGRTALALGQVRAMPAWSSLWSWQPRMRQIVVEGLQLDVRRDRQGRLRVAGLDTGVADGDEAPQAALHDENRAVDWLLAQHEIVLRQAMVRWTDEARGPTSLALQGVELVVRNGLVRHQWRLDASPPAEWGDRFTLIGQFSRTLLEPKHERRAWSGTAYASLPRADAGALGQHVSLPFELPQGRAAVRAWLDVQRGEWQSATADLVLADVQLRLAPALQPLSLSHLQGRWQLSRPAGGVELRVQGLQARTGEGLEWPAGDLSLRWQQGAASDGVSPPVTGGALTAQRIDLAVLAALATRLPVGAPVRQALESLAPSGQVSGLSLRWEGEPDAPSQYEARATVSQLSLASQTNAQAGGIGRPGLSGADIDLEMSSSGGKARLAVRQGFLRFPGVFEDADIPVRELQADLDWRLQPRPQGPPAVALRVRDARLANDDAVTTFRADWRTGAGEGSGAGAYLPGVIDLQGDIVSGRADRVAAYLPLSLSSEVRRWVSRAVKAGTIERGSFAVKGDVWQIPYANPGDNGVFRIGLQLRDGQFDYLPSVPAGGPEPAWVSPWPGFTQVSGDLLFDRATMRLDKLQGRLWGVQLRDVQARIDDLQRPMLRVQGEGRGPVADLLRFVDVSPVGQWIGGGLKPVSASGQGDLSLELGIPLEHPERSTVRGIIQLPGNDLRIRADTPLLQSARGRVEFSEQGFRVIGATARALGGELSFEGGSQPDGSLRFAGQGTVTAEGLRADASLQPLPWVAQRLRGQTAWKAELAFAQGQPELTVTTDGLGMASDWPAPLAKTAAQPWATRWHSRSLSPTADEIRLDVGGIAQMRLLRQWPEPTGPATVTGAALGLYLPAPAAVAGQPMAVKARLDHLDVDAWMDALKRTPFAPGVQPPATAAAEAGGAASPTAESTSAGWPSRVLPALAVQAEMGALTLAGRRLPGLSVSLQEVRSGPATRWRARWQSDAIQGQGDWQMPRTPADSGRLTLKLDHLSLPLPAADMAAAPLSAPEPQRLTAAEPTPRWPAVDLQIEALSLRGRPVGSLSLTAAPVAGGTAPLAWRVEDLALRMPGATLKADGQWQAASRLTQPPTAAGLSGEGRMALNLELDLQDSAKLAAHWGWQEALRGGNGKLSGQVSWPGAPWAMDLATLDGTLLLALGQGQFLRAEPGIGRLLGILSLQSLPRRLMLDFRDIVQQGFAFDEVRGEIRLSAGQATTEGLRMSGVQATVLIGGSADLLRETQALRVVIVPEVNAGAASLAYLAINPAVGLGTFLAQLVLRDPLRAAGSREFLITGPMAEPKVERVERNAASSTGSAMPPASAPGSAGSSAMPSSAQRAEGRPIAPTPSP